MENIIRLSGRLARRQQTTSTASTTAIENRLGRGSQDDQEHAGADNNHDAEKSEVLHRAGGLNQLL